MKSADSDDFGERGFCPTRNFFFVDVSGFFLTALFFAIGLPLAAPAGAFGGDFFAALFCGVAGVLATGLFTDFLACARAFAPGIFADGFFAGGCFFTGDFFAAADFADVNFFEEAFARADFARVCVRAADLAAFLALARVGAVLRAFARRGAAFLGFAFTDLLGLLSAILVAMLILSSFAQNRAVLLCTSSLSSGTSHACPAAPNQASQIFRIDTLLQRFSSNP